MALLLRRIVVSLLIPYLWRRWRGRAATRTEPARPLVPPTGLEADAHPV